MAIVNELGMQQLCGVMGTGASAVSLAACHLLQVMFEALTQDMRKDFRGKDEAMLAGETGVTFNCHIPVHIHSVFLNI